ncbi:SKN7 [Enterospora canceri]|uniref:SKN7 n=1 Tax=Enterospora canceri TaxID=1081671 RepID=A0A1Y1S5Z9_9MICR|nr:SKN7 [Enterospora canceri]
MEDVICRFVRKLLAMIEDAGNSDMIGWSNDGKSFIIFKPIRFAKHVLNVYFGNSKISSFVRQLNKYGFHKQRVPEEISRIYGMRVWVFKHTHFIKGRYDKMRKINRQKENGNSNIIGETYLSSDSLENNDNDANVSVLFSNCTINILTAIAKQLGIMINDIIELRKELNKVKEHNEIRKIGKTYLICDENEKDATNPHKMLRECGFNALIASDTARMSEIMNQMTFKFVIVSKENKHFMEMIVKIHSINKQICIIVISNNAITLDSDLARNKQIMGVLSKPITKTTLINIISKLEYLNL